MAGAILSASSVDWTTPIWVIDLIQNITPRFDLDPCSNINSKVNANEVFSLPTDSLKEDWSKYLSAFVNPPFGSSYLSPGNTNCLSAKEFKDFKELEPEIAKDYKKQVLKDWVKKCIDTYGRWKTIAKFKHFSEDRELWLLIPDQRSATHWHKLIFPNATAIVTFNGRVAYDNGSGKKSSPSIGSTLVYFGHQSVLVKKVFEREGHHVEILKGALDD